MQRPEIGTDALRSSLRAMPAKSEDNNSPEHSRKEGKTSNLNQYTVNLTERARQGKIDSVLGRDFEVRQIVDILTRRRQNNPILVGEAGVVKTAVLEGFALGRNRS